MTICNRKSKADATADIADTNRTHIVIAENKNGNLGGGMDVQC